MTTVLDIPAHEHAVIRVFALDLSPEEAARWSEADGDGPHPLAEALGAEPFDPRFAEIVRLSDIAEMGLPDYLAEGYDVPREELDPFAERLRGLSSHVAVVMSSAFADAAQEVTVRAPLRLVATFQEAGAETPLSGVSAESARGQAPADGTPGPPDDAAAGGRRGVVLTLIALAVLVLLAVAALAGAPR
ncbi:hypothetical protein [Rhodosalinus sp. 5P4]|uniref:hypothetical protein n=1 Tax=Rhodosalinus sp. 5P4 TaxID=3239196 RepID=UPI0035256B90